MTKDINKPKAPRVPLKNYLYDIFKQYHLPLSHVLERRALDIISDDNEYNKELWCEIHLIEDQLNNLDDIEKELTKSYDTHMRKIVEKRKTLFEKQEVLKNGVEKSFGEKVARDIKDAIEELVVEYVAPQGKKQLESDRYRVQRISFDTVEEVCIKHDVTPRMVLPLMDSRQIKDFFDKDCQRYRR